jgi:hypothetical protein
VNTFQSTAVCIRVGPPGARQKGRKEVIHLRLLQAQILQWRSFGVTLAIVPVVSSAATRQVLLPYLGEA